MWKGNLPNSPYNAIRLVDFLTPSIRLRNFVWISSMSDASFIPHTSDPKFRIDPTSVSKSLHFWATGNSTVLNKSINQALL